VDELEVRDRLIDIFADVFETTPDRIDESMNTENTSDWDSMRSIVLATTIESEFDIAFSDSELVSLNSFHKIQTALQQKGVA